jgi:hypothetical protein
MRPNPKVAAQADEIFGESSSDEQERPLPGAADPPHAHSADGAVGGGAGAGQGESGRGST